MRTAKLYCRRIPTEHLSESGAIISLGMTELDCGFRNPCVQVFNGFGVCTATQDPLTVGHQLVIKKAAQAIENG
ncbi:MAG TPA: hypothetical protein VK629_08715 [Steroidobacteraceae bacterium]|nr:hypothetical protein [Steroidobacteraceae bacterium]